MTLTWRQRMQARRDRHSWHWFAHGVTPPTEEHIPDPSPYRGHYQEIVQGVTARGIDYDPTRGAMIASEHRSNAGLGASHRARERVAARKFTRSMRSIP